MASLKFGIRRYLADSESPRQSQLRYAGTWLDIKWDPWDDKHSPRGFRFRTGHARHVWDAGDRGGGCETLRVIEVVNPENSRLLDLQVEPVHWDFW